MKPKKLKRTMFPIGINSHPAVDNVITLYRSSNDLYDGTMDYIFFKILNLNPEEYFNMIEMNELTDNEIRDYNNSFKSYDEKFEADTNDVLSSDIKKIIEFVRKRALKDGLIEELGKNSYLETSFAFNFTYILKRVMDFYKIKKGEVKNV